MATVNKAKLSGSTDGRMILVVQTATAGTTIHTARAVTGDDNFDEVWLWAVNADTTPRKLTIEWGGVTAPGDIIEITIPAESGLINIIPGLPIQNSKVVAAFCAAANVVSIAGYVNEITA